MAPVTVIIPAYGRQDLTESAVSRLRDQSLRPEHIIVTDDGSPEPIRIPAVEILRHNTNRGFAAAVNSGVAAAQTELVAVINNDVNLAPDWLERLTQTLTSESVAFACGKLFRPDGRLDGTFDLISRGALAWRAGNGRVDGSLWRQPRTVRLVSFTAVMLRRQLFERVGILDESYHSYYEDVEWSLRAALAGLKGRFEPEATGIHTGSATAGAWSAYSTRQLLINHRRLAMQHLLPRYTKEYRIARALLRSHCLKHGQWPHVPAEEIEPNPPHPALQALIEDSEAELYQLQEASGWDRLWQWYFQLAGRPGK